MKAPCTESSSYKMYDDTDPSKSTPLEQVRFCQIQCVRDTPQNRRTKKIITLNLKEKGNDPVRNGTSTRLQMQINIIACGPQQPEKTTPKTRHYPTCDRAELPEPHHSNAKQLDVCNTSQPLPSSLTEVYSDLHLLNRGVPAGRHGPTTNCTMPPSSLTTIPQLTPTPMPTPVTHSNPESTFFPHPNGCTRRTMTLQIISLKIQAKNRWRRRRIKSALFPRESRPLLLAVQPTIA